MTMIENVAATLVNQWIVTSFVTKSDKLRVNIVDYDGHIHLHLNGAEKISNLAETLKSILHDYDICIEDSQSYGGTSNDEEPF